MFAIPFGLYETNPKSIQYTHLVGGGEPTVALDGHALIVRCLFDFGEKDMACYDATSCATVTHEPFVMCLAVVTSDVELGLLFSKGSFYFPGEMDVTRVVAFPGLANESVRV